MLHGRRSRDWRSTAVLDDGQLPRLGQLFLDQGGSTSTTQLGRTWRSSPASWADPRVARSNPPRLRGIGRAARPLRLLHPEIALETSYDASPCRSLSLGAALRLGSQHLPALPPALLAAAGSIAATDLEELRQMVQRVGRATSRSASRSTSPSNWAPSSASSTSSPTPCLLRALGRSLRPQPGDGLQPGALPLPSRRARHRPRLRRRGPGRGAGLVAAEDLNWRWSCARRRAALKGSFRSIEREARSSGRRRPGARADLFHLDGDELRDAALFHRHAVERRGEPPC